MNSKANIPQSNDSNSFGLVVNIGELITCDGFDDWTPSKEITAREIGIYENAWISFQNGKILDYGTGIPPESSQFSKPIDAKGQLLTPGLIDAHTHPVYGGDRSFEFSMRLDGKGYQEIVHSGGGIHSTVRHTRDSDDESLLASTKQRFQESLSWGVTTLEAKSGYGQSVEDEIRSLEIIKHAADHASLTVFSTCLGLHAWSTDTTGMTKDEFCQHMTAELLPEVKKRKLATAVDAFVENGFFEVEDCEAYMMKAKELDFDIRIHADEFSDSGAAQAAAKWNALSADHLEEISDEGRVALAQAGVVGIVLPGTSLYSNIPFANARKLRDNGIRVAVATDANPGSCRINNLPLMISLAGMHGGLTAFECIASVTESASRSLKAWPRKGSLSRGSDADFTLWTHSNHREWLADFGQTKPCSSFISGQAL